MLDAVKQRKQHQKWQKKHDALAPRAGDEAPDFELGDAKGEGRLRLSDFRGERPVALIFGSYT
jgi:hypothetical protein